MKGQNHHKKSRIELLKEFQFSPPDTLFKQDMLCAVLDCKPSTAERDRWAGSGVPFIKIGRAVRYRKCDIQSYLDSLKVRHSTVKPNTVGGLKNA